MKLYRLLTGTLLSLGVLSSFNIAANPLFSLENLERERATFLATMTDANLKSHERRAKGEKIYRRVTDVERMVLRDERVSTSNSVLAKKAFQNYDLTFLVHASAETKMQPLDHWLTELNISSDSLLSSKIGYR